MSTAPTSSSFSPLKVFAWLTILTVLEIGLTYVDLSKPTLAAGLILSAIAKAILVALYFMHMKFEGKLIWGMVVASIFVGVIFLVGLVPDIVVGYWR